MGGREKDDVFLVFCGHNAAVMPKTAVVSGHSICAKNFPRFWILFSQAMRARSRIRKEAVADATDGDKMLGGGRVVFDVATEAHDEVVDGACVGVFVDAPDLFEDLFAGDDLAFALGEVTEEVGFHEREMGDAVGGDELEGVEANGAVVEGELVGSIGELRRSVLGCGLPCGAAEQGFEADEENAEVEWLGEVVVGPGFDAFENLFGA